jgi:hypothetical protein
MNGVRKTRNGNAACIAPRYATCSASDLPCFVSHLQAKSVSQALIQLVSMNQKKTWKNGDGATVEVASGWVE